MMWPTTHDPGSSAYSRRPQRQHGAGSICATCALALRTYEPDQCGFMSLAAVVFLVIQQVPQRGEDRSAAAGGEILHHIG